VNNKKLVVLLKHIKIIKEVLKEVLKLIKDRLNLILHNTQLSIKVQLNNMQVLGNMELQRKSKKMDQLNNMKSYIKKEEAKQMML